MHTRAHILYILAVINSSPDHVKTHCLHCDIVTFPKIGAIPIITEAKADRTCWEESDDNSCTVHYKVVIIYQTLKNKLNCNLPNGQTITLASKKFTVNMCTFTQGRICWIDSSGLKIRQNLVTLPADAIRTSASLSRSKRTYAGTKSVLWIKSQIITCLNIDTRERFSLHHQTNLDPRNKRLKFIWGKRKTNW